MILLLFLLLPPLPLPRRRPTSHSAIIRGREVLWAYFHRRSTERGPEILKNMSHRPSFESTAPNMFSSIPLEIWLEIAERCSLSSRIGLALCNRGLWININRFLKPLTVLKHYQKRSLNLSRQPFCWLSLRLLLKHFPNHVSCPSCHYLHPIRPIELFRVSERDQIQADTFHCQSWLTWTKSIDFQMAIQIAHGKWFLWSEGRLIMEQMRNYNSEPLERINKRVASGIWQSGVFSDRLNICSPDYSMKWWSRAIFLVVNDHLVMREENHGVGTSDKHSLKNRGLAMPDPCTDGSSGFSARPCHHDLGPGRNLFDSMANLRRQARSSDENADGRVTNDMYCPYCTTCYSFIVEQIKSCPKKLKKQCQHIIMVRWIDFGDFRCPTDKQWNSLTHSSSRALPYKNLSSHEVELFGRSIAEMFEEALASSALNAIGGSDQLPLSQKECSCSQPYYPQVDYFRVGPLQRLWRSIRKSIIE
jgi:hypothetical protein